jgi:hypothetical protein
VIWRLVLRNSAAIPAIPVIAAIAVAHTLIRDHSWVRQWDWSLYQIGFTTVLVGPVVAGVTAFEGTRVASSRDAVDTSLRPLHALFYSWSALVLGATLVYLSAVVVIVGYVVGEGAAGPPPARTLLLLLPPLSFLAGEAGLGLALGWRLRRRIAAPIAAIGSFVVIVQLGGQRPADPLLPSTLSSGSLEEQRGFVRRAVAELVACH